MSNLQINKPWADRFLPDQQRLIKQRGIEHATIRQATLDEDMRKGFDNVFEIDSFRFWPVRVRRPDCKYRDFTIRTNTPNALVDEYDKIMGGYGDAYLYGWTTPDSERRGRLQEWIIVDLHKFRADRIWVEQNRRLGHNHGLNDSDFWCWSWQELDDRGLLLDHLMFIRQPALFTRPMV